MVLLGNNQEFFADMRELATLYEHFSWWLAKYDILKDDPNMATIYVGPRQNKPFPQNIEDLIKKRIDLLKEETGLTEFI